jgi:hypothetical protein
MGLLFSTLTIYETHDEDITNAVLISDKKNYISLSMSI